MSAITAKASRKMKKYAVLTREPRCFLGSFDFSWEQRKLGELCNITTGKLDANAMVSDGQYDFYTSGIDVFKIDVAAFEGPAITIAGNGASVGYMHLADGKFNAYQRTYVLTDFLADRQFLNVAIGNELPNKIQEEVRGSGIPYIVLNMLTDLAIPFPSHEEQYAIGVYFQQLDNLITLHQRKCANLCSPSQVVFSLLFATSTFSWEQRKLGELVDRVVRKNTNNESTLPLTISAQYGLVDQITYFNNRVASRDVSNYYLVLNGEFAYNKSTSDGYPFGAVKRLDLYEKGVLSTLYIVFSPKKEQQVDSDFLTVFFDTDRWHKGVAERAAEGARNHGLLNISAEDFFDIDLSVPKDVAEQKQIGAFIRQLDNLITLHQRECISFTGRADRLILTANKKRTTSSWEQRKLGEIGSVSMCRRIFKEQTSETGDIPFYKIGTFGADPDAFISRELFEEYKSKYPYPQKGDILISASGSIGRTVEFAGNNEYFQDSNIVWLNHDERLSNPFLKCFYSVVKWAGIEGSTIKRLYNDNILNTVICMPSVPEQKRIGLFFENLDNLITLHQRKPFLMKWRTSDANRNQTNRLVL